MDYWKADSGLLPGSGHENLDDDRVSSLSVHVNTSPLSQDECLKLPLKTSGEGATDLYLHEEPCREYSARMQDF